MEKITYLGYTVEPDTGVVYGKRGQPIRKIGGGGYLVATNRTFSTGAHRLVWESVHGPIPAGLQVNHINGVKTDNRLANLELVTPSENTAHAYRIGLSSAKGVMNGRAVLCPADAVEIRKSSLSQRALARKYSVSRGTIRDILYGNTWKDAA